MLTEQDFKNIIEKDAYESEGLYTHVGEIEAVAKRLYDLHLAECERLTGSELLRFFDWFQRNQFKIMKKNPKFVPGEGYSGTPNHEWSVTEVLEMYHKENPPKSDKNETERLMELAFNAGRFDKFIGGKFVNAYPTYQDYKNSLNAEEGGV